MLNNAYKYTCILAEDNRIEFKKYHAIFSSNNKIVIINNDQIIDSSSISEKLINNQPDILILDIELEDCTAFDIIDKLPQKPERNYYIILLTGTEDKYLWNYIKTVNIHSPNKTILFLNKNEINKLTFDNTINTLVRKIENDMLRICHLMTLKNNETQIINHRYSDIIALEYHSDGVSNLYYYDIHHNINKQILLYSLEKLKEHLLSNQFFIQVSLKYIVNIHKIVNIKSYIDEDENGKKESRKTYHITMSFHEVEKDKPIKITSHFSKNFIAKLDKNIK